MFAIKKYRTVLIVWFGWNFIIFYIEFLFLKKKINEIAQILVTPLFKSEIMLIGQI